MAWRLQEETRFFVGYDNFIHTYFPKRKARLIMAVWRQKIKWCHFHKEIEIKLAWMGPGGGECLSPHAVSNTHKKKKRWNERKYISGHLRLCPASSTLDKIHLSSYLCHFVFFRLWLHYIVCVMYVFSILFKKWLYSIYRLNEHICAMCKW